MVRNVLVILALVLVATVQMSDGLNCYQCFDCGDLKENKSTLCKSNEPTTTTEKAEEPTTTPEAQEQVPQSAVISMKGDVITDADIVYKSCYKHTASDKTSRGCVPTGEDFCKGKDDCHTCDEDDCNTSASLVASAVLGFASLVALRLVH